ncbi:DEAD-box ATP-dependent RNA helicase 52B [Lathyrus oleraceus]|uniref:DEAD-box ATP-dependent RNA helicase 52 n=2 Tax=Pisum sativum TaxID=3888 RepID=A0A9D4ZXP9_PEA|nr:DEAD-box ATP-dependent RNA helicase 52 [Pisum sativum]KAI5440779.1 DEAD-box ATP-dependent RNA helicase 52B [Pisum sativum]
MAWSDSTTHKQSRPSQPLYVPQFRSNAPPPYNNRTHFPPSEDSSSFNRSTHRPRGRGGYGYGPPRHFPRPEQQQPPRNFNYNHDPPHRNNRPPVEPRIEPENGVVANFEAYESIPVEATGENVPPPVNVFAETELHEDLKNNIERCKYVKPTPVQRYAIPIAVVGRDLMACAQTGSGKTAAFCFPIISGIMKDRLGSGLSAMPHGGGSDVAYPTALILSPTRELSCQIHAEANKFAYQTGVKIAVAYGGAPIGQQLRVLERGVDILVATPGRLVDMIERERVSLKKIKYLALDEADRMLDMGFEHQIRNIVQQMNMPAPGARQTLLFSATFPDNIQKLASDFLSNYVFLAVGRVGSSTELIVQKIESVQDMEKRNRLVDLLRRNVVNGKLALSLIFVETKKGADALESWLCRSGFPAIAIHGDKALAQCRMVLNDLGVDKVRDQDTAVAAKTVAINCVRHTGAIASSRAAEIYGLDILAEGIQVITFAIAQLGWIAGPSMMLLFAFIIYYTSTLLSVGYRTGDQLNGKRNYTYTQAVRAYLGGYKVKLCGVVNKFLTVAINVTIWDKHASPAGLVCLLFTIIGGVLYQQSVTGNCSMLSV